jgi:hypothetical protein
MYIPKHVAAEYIRVRAQGGGLKRSLSVPSSMDQGAGFCATLLVRHVFIVLTEECNTMAERKLGQAGRDYPLKNSCRKEFPPSATTKFINTFIN